MHSTHFSAEITYRVKKPFFCHLINHFKYLDYKFCRRNLRLTGKSQNLPIKVLRTLVINVTFPTIYEDLPYIKAYQFNH